MNGLDTLLNKAILQSIQNELDANKLKRIEDQLHEQGFDISEIVSRIEQVKNTLFEFEHDFKRIEDKVLRNFLTLEEDGLETWIVITNRFLTELILKAFADEDKKKIMDLIRNNSETIPKILSLCNLPNTSGYRKIKQLIDDGFVMPTGMAETFEGRRALLYRSIIQKIQININKNEITAKMLVPKESIDLSQIVKTVIGVNDSKGIIAN